MRRYGTRPLGDDQWDGYDAARSRLLALLAQGPANPVVLTGDLHSDPVSDLSASFEEPAAPIVATEFMGTSISSLGDMAGDERWRTCDQDPSAPVWTDDYSNLLSTFQWN